MQCSDLQGRCLIQISTDDSFQLIVASNMLSPPVGHPAACGVGGSAVSIGATNFEIVINTLLKISSSIRNFNACVKLMLF